MVLEAVMVCSKIIKVPLPYSWMYRIPVDECVEVVLHASGACILSHTWGVDPTRHERFSRVCEVDMWSYAWCTGPINDAQEKEKVHK